VQAIANRSLGDAARNRILNTYIDSIVGLRTTGGIT